MCSLMTMLGYGEEIRRRRTDKYRDTDMVINSAQSLFTVNTAGSKAEGLTCPLESDVDCLFVLNDVLCVESGTSLRTVQDDKYLLRIDMRAPPGYCKLLQERETQTMGSYLVQESLCDNGYGEKNLSSALWINLWINFFKWFSLPLLWNNSIVNCEIAGPSIPDIRGGKVHNDKVFGLRCHCNSILQRWAARPRHWPSKDIIAKVVSLGAYVTPVGSKESEYKHMEWRICFNTGEAELVNNLTDTHAKVYVILRMILKEIIKPENKEITSFVLKNIVLWQAEKTPRTEFRAGRFFHWLHDGLKELKTAIENRHFRYYMIPERNLMAACGLDDALQSKWVADITDMMEEGHKVILRLEKIRKAIVASPEPMLWFSKNKIELEMLELELFTRVRQCKTLTDYNIFTNAIRRRKFEIVREVKVRMTLEGGSSHDELNALLDVECWLDLQDLWFRLLE
ncbi:hypothetical protein DPMN_159214 [Dreissena polymorpha]|uniref:Mab-21-like HhH/H2TH-like domain-containing protein n=1 Tax=Dreissena polymorpha TaxID=45954 RepID=A0A9D4IQJ3_DREPO|nr:hypothetical protein DPMN_159214 [Dreissena polymorpha]